LRHLIQELEAANLPVELALVPFIESNYDPFSISSSGAVGLWQFMPKTGRLFNLDKSWWTEDRHDPFRSTHAAIGYFKYLLERFDQDIYLALAAYNAGPTYLDRQIRKNKRRGLQTNFWSLNLSNQTSNYVPKYIAMKELVFNSEKYGIILPDIPVKPVVKKIQIPGQVEIMVLSEYLDIKPELVYKLNAGYTKWASAPTDESIFYIPIEKNYLLDSEDNPFDNESNINWISHIIERGDSLWKLAIKYDTEVGIIKQINYMNSEVLSIGIKYNINIDDLAKMNSLNKSSYLQLGQQLTIGNKNIYRNMDSKKRTILYSVKQGDNLYKISDLFDVSIKSIKDINNFKNSDLMPGQIIKIGISAF
jgi:membrane-bound lytic murein transglycosylase D